MEEEEHALPNLADTDYRTAQGVEKALEPDDNIIRLSTGVILTARKANANMLIRAMTAHPRPQPPVHFIKEMGREMENTDDPEYIKRCKAHEMEYSSAMLNVLIALGTTLKSVPKGFGTPEDSDWLADYATLDLPIHPESKQWRYITWVMYKAAITESDTELIMRKVGSLSGIREETALAAQSFPGRQ